MKKKKPSKKAQGIRVEGWACVNEDGKVMRYAMGGLLAIWPTRKQAQEAVPAGLSIVRVSVRGVG